MQWYKYFHEMKCSIQRGEAELKGTFHLSPNANNCSLHEWEIIYYSFYITWTKIQILKQNKTKQKTDKKPKQSKTKTKQNKTKQKQTKKNIEKRLYAGSITQATCTSGGPPNVVASGLPQVGYWWSTRCSYI